MKGQTYCKVFLANPCILMLFILIMTNICTSIMLINYNLHMSI